MTREEFLELVRRREPLAAEEVRGYMHEMSERARRITFEINGAYHTPEELRALLSELFGREVDPSVRLFPPFYTDYGQNIHLGRGVFINACCHFQDHGGVTLGDGCQIGHDVVFATLDHGLEPEERQKYNEEMRDSIENFLKDYNKTHKYSIILSKIESNILYADKAMNITQDVLKGLNKRYKASKEKK